jgi:hypothetical protein
LRNNPNARVGSYNPRVLELGRSLYVFAYRPRSPEDSPLFLCLEHQLATFLERANEAGGLADSVANAEEVVSGFVQLTRVLTQGSITLASRPQAEYGAEYGAGRFLREAE